MIGGFVSIHPMVSALYFIGLLLHIMWLNHPLYLLIAWCCLVILHLQTDNGEGLRSVWKGYSMMALVVIVINPLVSSRGSTILTYFRNRPITLESVVYGFVFALLLITMLMMFQVAQKVITEDRFLYLTAWVLPRTAFVIVMIQRLIPLLHSRLQEINAVAKTQGRFNAANRLGKVRVAMESLNVLLVWTLEESLHTAVSMRASGYGSSLRSSYVRYRMETRDYFLLMIMGVMTASIVLGGVQGYGQMNFYPSLAWKPVHLMHTSVYIIWCALPIFINLGEIIQWKLIRLKT